MTLVRRAIAYVEKKKLQPLGTQTDIPDLEDAPSHLTPLLHTALLRRVSIRTSGVPISFTANLRISLMARGALFLKPLQLNNMI